MTSTSKSKARLFPFLLLALLASSPISRAHEDSYEYLDDGDEGGYAWGDHEQGVDDAPYDERDVVGLTSGNFDQIVGSAKFALVEFYAPWCGHCKTLRPIFAGIASRLKEFDESIVMAKVDCTVQEELAASWQIKAYPEVILFRDGEKFIVYDAKLTEEELVEFIVQHTQLSVVHLESAAKLAEAEADGGSLLVGYFKALEGVEYDAFVSLAHTTMGCQFVGTTSADLAAAAGMAAAPAVSMIRNFNERELVLYHGAVTAEGLAEFIAVEQLPLTVEYKYENLDAIFRSGNAKQVFLLASAEDLKLGSPILEVFRSVASHKRLRGQLTFATADTSTERSGSMIKLLGLEEVNRPVIAGLWKAKHMKYLYPGKTEKGLSQEPLLAWAIAFLEGSADPVYESAALPKNEVEDGVAVVVASTIKRIVMDSTKDVMLEVYAPWCEHCKSLEPTYKQLAEHFKDVTSVVIAKMDGTENDHPAIVSTKYPTLLFFQAGSSLKDGVKYEGQRTLEDFVEFIEQNAAIPFGDAVEDPQAEAKDEL